MSNDKQKMPAENFKRHPELNFIKVSSLGRVYSIRAQKMLKQGRMKNGYLRLVIRIDGKSTTKLVHLLVAETFLPNPNQHETVNHIDGDKENNSLQNLEWCTYAENNVHAHALGLNYISNSNRAKSSSRASEVWKLFRERKARGENPDKRNAFKDYKSLIGNDADQRSAA
ncbi:MAG: HNH endonuclease [Gammaproteobacteria bacterium]|nr:HNH endonuclease [Gammaproteobacteria bacterium]